MKNILMIVNPVSGKGNAEGYAHTLAELLKEEYHSEVTIKLTEKSMDAFKFAANASEDRFDTVICLGGDGTVNETVNGIYENEHMPIFGFVPLGTVNDYGRVLGFSMEADEAVEQFRKVDIVESDVASINDQKFINVVALGSIAESVMETDSDDKNRLGILAYLKDGISAFFNQKALPLIITTSNGQERHLTTTLLLVGLTSSIASIENMMPNATYDDGLVHLIAVKGSQPHEIVRAALLSGNRKSESDGLLVLSDKSFQISIQQDSIDKVGKVVANVDGDEGPILPLDIKVVNRRLKVIKPS